MPSGRPRRVFALFANYSASPVVTIAASPQAFPDLPGGYYVVQADAANAAPVEICSVAGSTVAPNGIQLSAGDILPTIPVNGAATLLAVRGTAGDKIRILALK